ncbi:MAG: TlpA disulfide reductase family protein [Ilumatobacter sp.]|nr:TlpA disulfide reductase family protein [Ilumatobacter sp.]MDG2439600.1 TlpA disulfide reductase family protein [Ilumatobacter sp.]
MKIARPRLLVGSLAVAALAIVAFALVLATQGSGDNDVDARLTPGVVTFPNDELANANVEGDLLPVVDLGDRDGNVISTASFFGQPLVINFWYASCPPCVKELPDFAEVHAEMGDDVRFIGVNTQDSVEEMERFAADRGVTYELYRDDFGVLVDAIRLVNTPTTLFVTADGGIIGQAGVLDADELRSEIEQLLAASA